MGGLIIFGIVINATITVVLGASGEFPPILVAIMASFSALSILGAIMIGRGQRRLGARMIFIGALPFVPIGLIAVFGAREVLDELKREAFLRKST